MATTSDTPEQRLSRVEVVKEATRPEWAPAREWAESVRRAERDCARAVQTGKLDEWNLVAGLKSLEKELRYARWARDRELVLMDRGTSNAWERLLRCPTAWWGRGRRSAWHYLHNSEHRSWVDHDRFWNHVKSGRPAVPAVYTSEPYSYDRETVERFARERGLIPRFLEREASMYYPGGTYFISLWAPTGLLG